jgi:hypothetical protein
MGEQPVGAVDGGAQSGGSLDLGGGLAAAEGPGRQSFGRCRSLCDSRLATPHVAGVAALLMAAKPDAPAASPTGKISPQFSARLARMRPDDQVRVVLILDRGGARPGAVRRRDSRERARAVETVRRGAESALAEIDEILARRGGHRLAAAPDALGTVAVEGNPAAIRALAEVPRVRAILEDQPISLAR